MNRFREAMEQAAMPPDRREVRPCRVVRVRGQARHASPVTGVSPKETWEVQCWLPACPGLLAEGGTERPRLPKGFVEVKDGAGIPYQPPRYEMTQGAKGRLERYGTAWRPREAKRRGPITHTYELHEGDEVRCPRCGRWSRIETGMADYRLD